MGLTSRPLLSRLELDDSAIDALAPLGLADWPAALRRLRLMADLPGARPPLDRVLPHLLQALGEAASPDRALVNLERFVQGAAQPAELLSRMADDPHMVEMLAKVFSGSQHLTEILLRNPGYVALLDERTGIAQIKEPGWLRAEARTATDPWLRPGNPDSHGSPALDALRRYQQREMLRIGFADLCGFLELTSVTAQLSHLADCIIQTALELVAGMAAIAPAGFCVIAMGKLGGRELNYSSDIDLLFLAREDGVGEEQAQRRAQLGRRLISALSESTGEGFLYRVDMRLRPWGSVGPLVSTITGYLSYLERHARLWERQALLKARVVAGDHATGASFLAQAQPLLFGTGAEAVRAEVHAMKQRTEAQLRRTGRTWGEVKLGEGSIRDTEFVVQYLQLVYGGQRTALRTGNTLEALERLAECGLLSLDDQRVLGEGYTFLRTVEHYLQILDYRQTHTLPANSGDLRYLAHRLGFRGPDAGARFAARYHQHSCAIRAVYLRHLAFSRRNNDHAEVDPNDAPSPLAGGEAMRPDPSRPPSPKTREHIGRLSPSYSAAFDPVEIERHAIMAARLDPSHPVAVHAEEAEDNQWRVTVVGFDYLGELSIICGLLFAHGFSISSGYVYTYEPGSAGDARRKIVDVFTVRPVGIGPEKPAVSSETWHLYETELTELVQHLQQRRPRVAQGALAKRVAASLLAVTESTPTLPPVDIEIDNDASARHTVLRISAADTPGFLYEFTNALAVSGIHIAQVFVISAGSRVHDTLFVTDARGQKITTDDHQRELRAATVLIKHFTHLLPRSPNPEAALLHFNEYLGELFTRSSWPDELASLERPEVLDALARLLGVSEFLWDDFLRMQYANLFPVVRDVDGLAASKSREQFAAELAPLLAPVTEQSNTGSGWQERINAFKDREMFRIDMRHILGRTPSFQRFAEELTDLVEAVLEAVIRGCSEELAEQFGLAGSSDGALWRFCLCALGKCGGRELGFASDIELMFVFDGAGFTKGPRKVTAPEYYERLVVAANRAIRARREGIFELDLQLRPYGKAGSLAVSLDSFRRYFAPGGAAWPYERQALVKLRAIAGDASLGQELEALRDAFVYISSPFDVAAMRAMRERQLRHLVEPGTINAKFSRGGLVDVEYIVQGLQITHGHREPSLRVANTSRAITALAGAGVVSHENAARLAEALTFLQQLINALRVVRGNSKDLTVPPPETDEFAFLARRLGYGNEPARLRAVLDSNLDWVQRLGTRLLG